MRKLFAAFVVVSFCACDPAPAAETDFTGTYVGALVANIGTCSVGSPASSSNSEAVTLAVSDEAGSILIDDGSVCADYTATISGNSASMNTKVCPVQTESYGTLSETFTGGTITLNGSVLAVSFNVEAVAKDESGNVMTDCMGSETGNLQRQ